ncbi:hypothetical protein [Scytonema sp. NUACC26]|uniref:hypothetical protein n=1 Tax=Scytonema sp. NUACC26 TaxID=3140176 RepID=UPI0038B2E281
MQLSVTLELVEVIDAPLTPTTDRLPVATDLVEPRDSEDSEQLQRKSHRVELVTEEDDWSERALQEYQTSCNNVKAENNLKASATQSQLTIPSARPPLENLAYTNRPPIEKLTYTQISQPGCFIRTKAPISIRYKQQTNSLLTAYSHR